MAIRASRAVIAAVVSLISVPAFVPTAAATVRVESTSTGGLVVTDKNGTFDDNVAMGLFAGVNGFEWRLAKTSSCGTLCVDLKTFEAGPGCRLISGPFPVACERVSGKVNVNLAGGNDRFIVDPTSAAIPDAITVNLSTGNDIAIGGPGMDTLQGGSGNDELSGGAGDDVIQGGAGDDVLAGDAGNDNLTGSDGTDRITPGVGADVADAGSGNDTLLLGTPARDERDDVNGGIGFDTLSYSGRTTALRIIEANLETLAGEKDAGENDVLRSIESYQGGTGNDIITGAVSSNASFYNGLTGNDTIFGSSGDNTLIGGAGADQLDGNAGNDFIDAKTGEGSTAVADPLIDCGEGTNDFAVLDLKDDVTPTGCENLDRAPAREGPHVRPTVPRVAAIAGGVVSIKLFCPRALRHPCAGTLALRLGAAQTARTRYSIAPGKSRHVSVRLGALSRGVGRRRVAQLVSLEPGLHGQKTTLRRVVLAG